MSTTTATLIRLRWAGQCNQCRREVAAGTRAWHDAATGTIRCQSCAAPDGSDEAEPVRASVPPPGIEAPETIDQGVAGRSARSRHERLRDQRERRVRERYGKLGVAAARLSGGPQHIAAWQQGAQGEERLARQLTNLLADTSVTLLHDRRIPQSVANIDHIAIGRGRAACAPTSSRLTAPAHPQAVDFDGEARQAASCSGVSSSLRSSAASVS